MFGDDSRPGGVGTGKRVAGTALLLAVPLWFSACGDAPSEDPADIPAVDVAPSLTVDVEDDPQAAPTAARLVGVLPGDYPPDLPVHLPASVIDFGMTGDGRRFVTLLSPGSPARVAAQIEGSLRDNGWAPTGTSSGWRKDGRRVRLQVESGSPGTTYRYEY